MATHDTCHGNQTDILTERRVWEPSEQSGQGSAKTIGIGRAGDFLVCRFAPGATFTGITGVVAWHFDEYKFWVHGKTDVVGFVDAPSSAD